MLYALHPVMDPQYSGSNFQATLKKCVEVNLCAVCLETNFMFVMY